ncbi:MAG: zinc-binding dehydrogenase [Atopobiaceae bacterium]|nr:zinc-binding dehydrogenase [Atopobiaceae bacterium]
MAGTMRALSISEITEGRDARLVEVPIPDPRPGWALVRVRGFGLNHSELELRRSEIRADYIKKPIIPGIEGVGEISYPGETGLAAGTRVCMLMGGIGRSWDGSYAEWCLVPASRLFTIPDAACGLPWSTLAAIPETYYTAWGSLFEGLRLEASDTLLVRGASCGLGYAAVQIAHALGSRVIATTHRCEYAQRLRDFGADKVVLDDGALSRAGIRAHKALELIGPRTLQDTLGCLWRGGICCDTGILGGVFTLDRFDPIRGIPNGCYLTGFFSNYPTQEAMDALFSFIASHKLEPYVAASFPFDRLPDALALQDSGGFQGKIVVTLG